MSLADLLRRWADDPAHAHRPYLRFEDERVSFAETRARAARWANSLLALRDPERPFHVGVLLENRPEFVYVEVAAAMAGAVVVGLNPTRRGEHLAADVALADCQVVVTETRFAPALDAALGPTRDSSVRVVDVDRDAPGLLAAHDDTDPAVPVGADDLFLLVFTSGTTAGPKAVMRGHGRLTLMAEGAAAMLAQATPDDVVYCAMPLFHSNAQILALGLSLAAGCGLALTRRFSKTRFLDDVRRHGATLFNYVGSPLAYVMDTPARPDDAENPLRLAYGNEGPRQYLDAFARRFGCRVLDSYGASECGVSFTRQDGDPPGSLGTAGGVAILNDRGEDCPPARLDAAGRVTNPEEAIGEIVNTGGVGLFEGYYKNPAATDERRRGGRYHTGDLGYRDADGYVYFAGRDVEWLRVDGENFLARPIETILQRHPAVFLAAVYAVPDAEAGDRVMAALALRDGATLDPAAFAAWIDAQEDLSPKWQPTFVRLVAELERSETNKVQKRALQRDGFQRVPPGETLLWRPRGAAAFQAFTAGDLAALRARFARAGNTARLDA
jgi:fatty-acyl-CoA synthase